MASAGVLWVSVRPSLEGFGTSLRRQLGEQVPQDTKAKVSADTSELEAKIKDATARLEELRKKQVDPKIDADASALEEAIAKAKAKLEELKASKTDPKIEADATVLEGRIAQAKAKLDELNAKRVNPEVRADGIAETEANIGALTAQLDALSSKRSDPKVTADIAQAEAELASLRAQLDALDGKRVSPKVDTNDAKNNINALVLAGASLGPALIPVAAGAAAALASIGPAALTGVGALLTLKMAFSGIGDAIKAFDTMQTQAGQNAGKTATQQQQAALSIASAQDGVTSAERSLAQARAQAADQAVSAAERVSNAQQQVVTAQRDAASSIQSAINQQISAEESLANAQRAEQTAQESLTQARKDAAAQLQSLTFSVQDNALSQRAAQIQLQDALATQAKNAAPAGSLQSQKDQLSVDQARQRITELQAQGKQLADQKAEADRKGVDGSNLVVNAQNQVTQAIQRTGDAQRALQAANAAVVKAQQDGAAKVAQAEQALSDARRAQAMQAMTSANSVASAQQGVVSAQRSLEQAQLSAASSASSASSATNAYADAMKKLSPAGRDFVNFYTSTLKPRLDELAKAAQSGLLPGLQQGIRNAFPALDQLKTWVGNVSSAMGDLAREAGSALTKPFWHDFFDFMNRIAAPTIKTLGETFGNFLQGAAGIMQALYEPVFVPIMNWFKDLSERVRDFGTSAAAGTNTSFNAFLDYVRENGPTIRDLIGELAKLIGNIVSAMSGQGALTLSVLVDVLKWINDLPKWQIQALIDLFVAIKLAKLGSNLKSDLDGVIGKLKDIDKMGGLKGVLMKGLVTAAGAAIPLVISYDIVRSIAGDAANDPTNPKFTTLQRGAAGATSLVGAFGQLFQGNYSGPGGLADWSVQQRDQLDRELGALRDRLFGATGGGAAKARLDTTNSPGGRAIDSAKKWWTDSVWTPTKDFFSGLSKDVSKWWTDDVWTPTKNFFTGLPGTISKWWMDDVWTPTKNFFTGLPGTISKWWTENVWNPTRDFFAGLPGTISKWWTDNVWTPTREFFAGLPGTISKWWTDNVWVPTRDFFTGLPGTIGKWWSDNVWVPTRDFFTGLPGTISKWWTDNVWVPTRDFFAGLPGTISRWWTDNVWVPTRDFFTGLPGTISRWWIENVWNPTRDFFGSLPGTISGWWNDNVWVPTRNFFTGLPDTMYRLWIDNVWTPTKNAFRNGAQSVIDVVNGFLDQVNKVAGSIGFTLNLHVPPVPQFAAGGVIPVQLLAAGGALGDFFTQVGSGFVTNGPRAIVGEGNPAHPEYVIPTDPAHRSRALGLFADLASQLGAGGVPGYDIGGVIGDIWGGIKRVGSSIAHGVSDVTGWLSDVAAKGIRAVVEGIWPALQVPANTLAGMVPATLNNWRGKALDWISGQYQSAQAASAATVGAVVGGVGSGVERWRPVVLQALGLMGQSPTLADTTLRRMNQESGGNPSIVNRWDSNWLRGTPSVGLMQVIGPTYAANKDARRDVGPYLYGTSIDPLSNILASMHYTLRRYGSLPAGYGRAGGYDEGGMLLPGITAAVNATGKPERILSAQQTVAFDKLVHHITSSRTTTAGGDTFHITPPPEWDYARMAREVSRQKTFARRTA